jgi:two-component system, chemotaxis family, CheB/CheR fusion protein
MVSKPESVKSEALSVKEPAGISPDLVLAPKNAADAISRFTIGSSPPSDPHETRHDKPVRIGPSPDGDELFGAMGQLQRSNEELQVANEELKNGRQKLQTINQDLITANACFQQTVSELKTANGELALFLASTDIPALLLDQEFRIKRFTLAMLRLAKCLSAGAGRMLSEFPSVNLGPELAADGQEALDRLTTVSREVEIDNYVFIRRMVPCLTSEKRIHGIAITFTNITDLKTAQSALDRMVKTFESVADTFYSLDERWRITAVNPAAERAPFGRPASKLLGRVIWNLFPGVRETEIHRRFLNAAKFQTLEHYEEKSPLDGRWYEVFMQGRRGGIDVYMRDITERRHAVEALRESEERFKAIAESTQVAISVVSHPDGNFIYVNPAHEKSFGYSQSEILGKAIPNLYGDDAGQGKLLGILQENGGVDGYEVRLKRKDGTPFWGLLSLRAITFDGKPARLGTFTDITERKQIEKDLRLKNEELSRFNRISVDRELRMIELKKEVNELCVKTGHLPRYALKFEKGNQ